VLDNINDDVIEAGGGTDSVWIGYAAVLGAQITLGVGKLAGIENATATGAGAFNLTGDAAANELTGNGSANILEGHGGNDVLDGKGGADTMKGGDGDDYFRVDNVLDSVIEDEDMGEDTVESVITFRLDTRPAVEHLLLAGTAAISGTGNGLANELTGNGAANVLTGLAGNDTLDGLGGADRLVGGLGDDTYYVNVSGDVVLEDADAGTDVIFSSASYILALNVEELRLTGNANVNATGNAFGNLLFGNAGNNILDGKAGVDTMAGGAGNDTYRVDDPLDVVQEHPGEGIDLVESSAATYELSADIENLALVGALAIHGIGNALDNAILGNAAANTLTGGGGNDILDGGLGNDTLIGGEGDDAYVINVLADEVLEAADSGIDTVRTTVSLTALRPLMDNVENVVLLGAAGIGAVGNGAANVLTGNAGANALDGAGGNDKLVGLGGNDKLVGGTGDDELDGGAGIDEMRGGAGDDLYRVDSASDKVIEAADEGIDTVRATISLSLVLMANVENLVLDGAALAGTGNALDNNIRGNAGNNTLNGGAGADTLIGGQGNDTYVLDSATDIVTELENEGLDTVQTTATLTLAQNVENALLLLAGSIGVTGNASNNVLTGNAGNNSLAGLAGNDTLVGNAGNDELDGGAGNDTMQGGAGNDVYHVDAIGDVVTELANAGIDTVVSAIGYVLAANLENLTLAPGAGAISGTGNAFANVLTGNEADNALDGAAGNDTIAGGQGNDSLRGGDGNDSLAGGSGDDLLDGGAGTDTMAGGAGDDSYVMDAQADQILELAGEGTDTVRAGAGTGFDLGSIPEVENLVLLGAVANGYGNALDNVITGNASANQLVGAAGNDTLAGGAGTDTLLGGDGDDVLDGGSGDDVMRGGTGNDIYVVDSASDQVLEDAGAGSDTVQTVISFVLGTNLEDLVLLGAASIDGTGNAAGNSITGNAGDNRLDGKAGDDTLAGGEGDDTYVVDSTGDEVIEETGAGHDVVRSSVAYALGANVEELVITQTLAPVSGSGNALDNRLENQSTWGAILSGGAGNDTLIGGAADDTFDFTGAAGADSMAGGGGNDTYYVDDTGDTVHESSGGGFDRVILTTAPAGAYTLADHVENAELGSSVSAGVELIGNDLENALTGSSGNDALRGGNGNDLLSGGSGDDTLEGGAGFDTLVGGAGNDLYLLGSDAETIAESAGGGIDTVVTSAGYALSDNLENLTLLGTSNVDATGNGAANTLTGNAGNNRLDGKAGADTMVGMGGDDVFVVDHTGDVVVEAEGEGRDTIRTSVDYSLPANVEDMVLTAYGLAVSGNGLDNTIALDGSTAGTVTGFSISGGAGDDVLAGGAGDDLFDFSGSGGADRMTGGNGNDTYHVDNAGDVVVEAGGAGTDTMVLHADSLGILTLAANVEKGLIATGSAAAGELVGNGVDNELTGGDGADVLRGLDGDDHLDGKLGADALHGGAGDDQYELGAGDSIHEGADAGVDTVFTALATVVLMDNVENLLGTSQSSQTLSGNALGNYLRGGDGDDALYGLGGDDALQGGAGADTLVGGVGDDIYVLEDPSDTIVELADEGQDSIQIQSKVANSTFTLSFANVENIWLIGGAGGESVHGNDLDNVITGNSTNNSLYGEGGNDTLDGGGGTLDRLYGGTGDDLYVLNSGLVETLEGENEGNDTVWIHGSLTLGANIENLTLLGSNADQGWGNALDNILTGNSGNNALNGFEGNDTLDGREGRDDLQGWGGDDVLIFDPLEQDWYSGGDGFDTLKVLGSGSTLNLAANFSGSIPFYQGLEAVDLTGTGNSSLIITLGQVGEMSWDTDILKIFGDTGDSVTSTGWGSEYVVGTIVDGGVTYDTYTSSAPESTGIALWVSQDVDVFIS
jgi:Ca2+-binding RTX toxin-like protein